VEDGRRGAAGQTSRQQRHASDGQSQMHKQIDESVRLQLSPTGLGQQDSDQPLGAQPTLFAGGGSGGGAAAGGSIGEQSAGNPTAARMISEVDQ